MPFQWVRRLTEPRQSQDAGWDIDRLEPEGSCRTGRHCQRLCYRHRPPASKGGKVSDGGGWRFEGEVEMGRLDEKMEIFVYQNVKKEGCVVGVNINDSVGIDVCCLWIYVLTSHIDNYVHPEEADN